MAEDFGEDEPMTPEEIEAMRPKLGGPPTPRWAATVTWKKSSGEVVARKEGMGIEEINGPELADIIEKGPPWGDAPIVIIELAFLRGDGGSA